MVGTGEAATASSVCQCVDLGVDTRGARPASGNERSSRGILNNTVLSFCPLATPPNVFESVIHKSIFTVQSPYCAAYDQSSLTRRPRFQ